MLLSLISEDIHCTSWTLLLYQLLSPCLFSGCGFVISVALTLSRCEQVSIIETPILRLNKPYTNGPGYVSLEWSLEDVWNWKGLELEGLDFNLLCPCAIHNSELRSKPQTHPIGLLHPKSSQDSPSSRWLYFGFWTSVSSAIPSIPFCSSSCLLCLLIHPQTPFPPVFHVFELCFVSCFHSTSHFCSLCSIFCSPNPNPDICLNLVTLICPIPI